MIIAGEKQDVAVSSEFKTSGFKIQASAKAFEILSSNIYTHKVRAVIREISCNAHDSHVAAGQSVPFRVHLPTRLEPFFSVRDFGIGLDDDSIREIFTTYFYSTKTNSNDYIGALGLGSKSPFCLVDSFTVTSWKNGEKNTYSCYKDEHGEPQIALLTSEKTTEHNGLEVCLSVNSNRIDEFKEEAVFVFKFFKTLPEINCSAVIDEINKEKADFTIVSNNYLFKNGRYGELYAVMGNVGYTIDESITQGTTCAWMTGCINFDIGELNFNPGRESLSLDEKTKSVLKSKIQQISSSIVADLVLQIENEQNPFNKFLLASSFSMIPGVKVTNTWMSAVSLKSKSEYNYYYKSGYGRYARAIKASINFPQADCEYYLIGDKKVSDRRIQAYVRDTSKKVAFVTQETATELGMTLDMLHDPDNIPKIITTRSSYKINKDIYEYSVDGHCVTAKSLPNEEKVYIAQFGKGLSADYPDWMCSTERVLRIVAFLKNHGLVSGNFKFYGVRASTTRTKAFKQGNWICFQDFFKKLVDGKVFESYNNLDISTLNKLHKLYEVTQDDRLKDISEIKSGHENNTPSWFPETLIKLVDHPDCQKITDFMDKYPMLSFVDCWDVKANKNALINYLNIVDKSN